MKHLHRTGAALLLLAAVIVYRLCVGFQAAPHPWLENFAPIAAIALCGGAYLPRRLAFGVSLGALFISDLFLNAHFHCPLVSLEMGSRYVALAATVVLGFSLRERASIATMLPASIVSSFLFYFLTNTSSWIGSPAYAHTFAGWWQALTVGLPGYAPTLSFFRASLISDALFSVLFVFCMKVAGPPERATAPSEKSLHAAPQ